MFYGFQTYFVSASYLLKNVWKKRTVESSLECRMISFLHYKGEDYFDSGENFEYLSMVR